MSCCEKGTSQMAATRVVEVSSERPTIVLFEYVGYTHLTITGSETRRSYHFDQPGARVLVDGRDRLCLSSVRVLRVVGEFPA